MIKGYMKFTSIILALCICTGCSILPKEDDSVAPPLKAPKEVTYDYKEVKKATLERKIQCSGHFISVSSKDLSFKNQNGKLKCINAKIGDNVKKGQIIAELLTDNIVNSVQQQQITLSKSKITLDNLRISNQKQEEALKAEISSLKKEYSNMKELSGVYSNKDLQDMQDKINEKQSSYDSMIKTDKNNVALSENDVKLNQLQMDRLNQELADSRIVSPIDGVISYVTDIKVGDNIEAYDTVVRISDPNDLNLSYGEDQISYFMLGAKVNIKCNNKDYTGTVVQTPSSVPEDVDESLKNTVLIKPEKITGIKIGDIADISLLLEKKENTIVIPKSALQSMGTRRYVYIMENGIRIERDVETGAENQSEVEILKGLSEGDKLIND